MSVQDLVFNSADFWILESNDRFAFLIDYSSYISELFFSIPIFSLFHHSSSASREKEGGVLYDKWKHYYKGGKCALNVILLAFQVYSEKILTCSQKKTLFWTKILPAMSEGLTWQADNRTDRPFNGKNALRLGRLWGRALRLEQDRGPSAAVRMLCLKEKRTEFSIRSDGIWDMYSLTIFVFACVKGFHYRQPPPMIKSR